MTSEDKFLTPEEVAERLHLKPNTIRLWLRDGTLKGVKLAPKTWRIRASEFEEWLSNRESGE